MRIPSHLRSRLAGAVAVSLACAVLGACGTETKDEGEGSSAEATTEVKAPEGMTEVKVPSDFPDRIPQPKAPHVVIRAEGKDPSWIMMAAYAEGTDLEAELEHFTAALKEDGLSIDEEAPLADVKGAPDAQQASVLASDDEVTMNVTLLQVKDEQPIVTITTFGDEKAVVDE